MNISSNVIEEINRLELEDLEILNTLILNRIKEIDKKQSILNNYVGIGNGIWVTDAQEYINDLRLEPSNDNV